MPKLYMMVGLPGSGKSTFIKEFNMLNDYVVISSDNLIEEHARSIGQTYNEVFKEYYKTAERILKEQLKEAADHGRDIIWDQTNLTKKSRAIKLALIPENYTVHAVVIPIPEPSEWDRRLGRPGKTIPADVIRMMQRTYEEPSLEEGFRSIWTPNNT